MLACQGKRGLLGLTGRVAGLRFAACRSMATEAGSTSSSGSRFGAREKWYPEMDAEAEDAIAEEDLEEAEGEHYTSDPIHAKQMLEMLKPDYPKHPSDLKLALKRKLVQPKSSWEKTVELDRAELHDAPFKYPTFGNGVYEQIVEKAPYAELWDRLKDPSTKDDSPYTRFRRAKQIASFYRAFQLEDERPELPRNVREEPVPVLNPDYFTRPFYRTLDLSELITAQGNSKRSKEDHRELLAELTDEMFTELRILELRAQVLEKPIEEVLPLKAQLMLEVIAENEGRGRSSDNSDSDVEHSDSEGAEESEASQDQDEEMDNADVLERLEEDLRFGEPDVFHQPTEKEIAEQEELQKSLEMLKELPRAKNHFLTPNETPLGDMMVGSDFDGNIEEGSMLHQPYMHDRGEFQVDLDGNPLYSQEEIRAARLERLRNSAARAADFLEDPDKYTGRDFDRLKRAADGKIVAPDEEEEYAKIGNGPKYADRTPVVDISEEEVAIQQRIAAVNGGVCWFDLKDPQWSPDGTIEFVRDSELLGFGPGVGYVERLVHVNRLQATRDFIRTVNKQTFWMKRFAPRDLDKLDLDVDVEKLAGNNALLANSMQFVSEKLKWAREVLKHDTNLSPAEKEEFLLGFKRFIVSVPDIYNNHEWLQEAPEIYNLDARTRLMRSRHVFQMPHFSRITN